MIGAKMRVIVERVHSAKEYLEYWAKVIADVHWFKKRRLFDYNRDEMTEEIAREFGKPRSIYLVARSQETEEILGVLDAKISRNVGTFGRWEPAVPSQYRNSGAGEVLIKEACSWVRENRVPKVTCILRYPYSRPETGQWHVTLYQKCGFVQKGLAGLMLLANLRKVKITTQKVENIHVANGGDFPLEEFVDFTRRAYVSTPEDKAIHERDPYVSSSDESMRLLRAVKDGRYGFSPPKCWKVAMLKDEAVGFIVAFMPRSKYRPSHGVIAELGVFPEFRRKGIAYSLIADIHECFKNHECQYSYVGTPKNNETAIRLYQKAGYKPVFQIINFEKSLLI